LPVSLRKIVGATKKTVAKVAVDWLKRGALIAIGALGATYWPAVVKWLKELFGMK
jgi:hypothetical protein